MIQLYSAFLQIPGLEGTDAPVMEQLGQLWEDTGFMRWPLLYLSGRWDFGHHLEVHQTMDDRRKNTPSSQGCG